MPQILRLRDGKRFEVSQKLHNILLACKVFYDPDAILLIGDKQIRVGEYDPSPPPEQQPLVEVPAGETEKKTVDMG